MALARNLFEGAVGVGLSLFISLLAMPLAAVGLGVLGVLFFPFVALLANLTIGLVQIRRTFRIMGWTIITTGVVSSVYLMQLWGF